MTAEDNRRADLMPGRDVPEPDGAVEATGHGQPPVWRKRYPGDRAGCASQWRPDWPTCRNVPEQCGAVIAPSCEYAAIRADRQTGDGRGRFETECNPKAVPSLHVVPRCDQQLPTI